MIHPNLGTMLCFISSDAAIEGPALDEALRSAVDRSFNRLTVDGDTSTNDTAILMANGSAGNRPISAGSPDAAAFSEALLSLCQTLAQKMARDGEGASRLLTVSLRGAATEEDAALLARTVAGSPLVKTAIFGADATWGRIVCALGYAGPAFDPSRVSVSFSLTGQPPLPVCRYGEALPFSEETAKALLLIEEITVEISVGDGPGSAQAWGCDLTYDYVKINGDYRS
jgi:glutamate N-acetyltransferase/amino-acid N-acetyltransferase